MARKIKVALPGLSRSAQCPKGTCHRLVGHKGACRATLAATAKPSVVKAVKVCPTCHNPVGVEVWSADRYTVQPETKSPKTSTRRTAAPKGQCRVVKSGTRCHRAYGHKQAGTRHAFALVTTLPTVGPKGRDVQPVKGKTSRRRNFVASGRPSSLAR